MKNKKSRQRQDMRWDEIYLEAEGWWQKACEVSRWVGYGVSGPASRAMAILLLSSVKSKDLIT